MMRSNLAARTLALVISLAVSIGAFVPPATGRGAEETDLTGGSAAEMVARARARGASPATIRLGGGTSSFSFREFQIGPLRVNGYKMKILVYKDRSGAFLVYDLSKSEGDSSQTHSYFFEVAKKSVKFGRNLKSASTGTGDQLGDFGKIRMSADDLGRKRRRGNECSSRVFRTGKATGRFVFKAGDEFFKTTRKRRVSAKFTKYTISEEPGCFDDGEIECFYGSFLGVFADSAEGFRSLSAEKTDGADESRQFFSVDVQSPPAAISHFIDAVGPPTSFTAAPDGSSAQVEGIGPFFTGSASFVADPDPTSEPYECGTYTTAQGPLTGDFTALFDSIGPQALSSFGNESAILDHFTP